MELRLYLDEDSMDQRLVRALRARGLDVETALGAKRPSSLRAALGAKCWEQRDRMLSECALSICEEVLVERDRVLLGGAGG